MVVGTTSKRPTELAFFFADRVFVDANVAVRLIAVFIELPILVAIGTEPVAAIDVVSTSIAQPQS